MAVRSNIAEVKSFLRESWSMGWPIILIMFFQFSMGLTDVYVAGYLGTDILAAVGYVGQLYWTLMILANGITVGTVSMISQAYGARNESCVGSITAHSLIMGVAISGVLGVLAHLHPASIVRLAGMPKGIQDIAADFLRIFSLVLVPMYVMIISSGVLRSSGRVRVAMLNSFIASLVNVILCLILGFGWEPIPSLGYIGIAWATAVGSALGMALNLFFLLYGPGRLTLSAFSSPLPRCIRNLMKLGVPSAMQQTAWNAGTLVVYFLVGGLQGGQITALAAMTAGVRIEAIIFLPVFAFNMASAVLTGNRVGAGDVAGARSGAKVTAALCFGIVSPSHGDHFCLGAHVVRVADGRPRGSPRDDPLPPHQHDRHAVPGHRRISFGSAPGRGRHIGHHENHIHRDVALTHSFHPRDDSRLPYKCGGRLVGHDHIHDLYVRVAGTPIRRGCLDDRFNRQKEQDVAVGGLSPGQSDSRRAGRARNRKAPGGAMIEKGEDILAHRRSLSGLRGARRLFFSTPRQLLRQL